MNVMIWLSSTQTHFSLTDVDLQISSKRAEIQQQLHGTAEVSDFLRKASCLSVLSMEFAYFIHVVDEELINLPWAHLSHLTIDGIRFPDCGKLSSLLYRLEDLGDLSKLSFWFNLENIPFNSASTSSTNAAYYAPWNALDNALSQGPFQKIEHIQMTILIDSQPLFGEDDEIEQREGPRFFPKVYHRINPNGYKLFWFRGE
ncbi:hypothetical protein C8Q75DRAFT_622857 [Abortiporus biennis]|nr:hypothetical protein C8Q75DRAFT_622857 [Abortiporus biennis]